MDRRRFVAAAGALFAAGLAGCSGDGDDDPLDGGGTSPAGTTAGGPTGDDGEAATSAEPTSISATAAVGVVVSGERIALVVRDVTETTSLGEDDDADDGNVFLVVRLALENTGADTFIDFPGFLDTSLRDAGGNSYSPRIAAGEQTFDSFQLAPGEVARVDLIFEVPADAGGLSLGVDLDAVSAVEYDRVTVALDERAESVGDLKQRLRVPVHGTGETVSRSDAAVTVHSVDFTDAVGEPPLEAPAGEEYAIVDVTVTNDAAEAREVAGPLLVGVKDDRGRSYWQDVVATSQLAQSFETDSELAPGESRRGTLAHPVPRDAESLYWVFGFGLWDGGDKAFWELR